MTSNESRFSKRTLLNITLAYTLFALSTAMALSQESMPSQARELTGSDIVGSLVAEALSNNPGLAAADKRYLAARQSIVSEGSLPNPKAQLTRFVESIQTRTGPQRNALLLQQALPWRGTLKRKRDIAGAQSEALWNAYAVQQFNLIDEIASQALEGAFLEKAIAQTGEIIELLRRLESIVENKVKAGGALSDLLRLQLEIQRMETLVARQTTARIGVQSQLGALLGRPGSLTDFQFNLQVPARIEADTRQWLDSTAERSPQIAMLRSLERSHEARERLARLSKKPDISLGLNYIETGSALSPNTPGSGSDPWALMIGVSLPIWGKANDAVALQSSLETEAIVADIENLQLQLAAKAQTLIAQLEDAQDRIQRYDSKLLPLARQNQEIATSSYQSGQTTILDLIDSDRTLLELETEYWRAAADAWTARWKLATLSGGLWLH